MKKNMNKIDAESITERINNLKFSLSEQNEKIESLYNEIESDLDLVGIVSYQDKVFHL